MQCTTHTITPRAHMLRDITNLPPAHGASGLSLSPLHRLAHISLTSPSTRPRTQSTRADFKHADSSGDEDDDDAKYSSGDESSDDAADSSVDDDTDGRRKRWSCGRTVTGSAG